MKSPFFSIIVPVYNVEKYILRCINSIILQRFTCFEVIVVDDETQDESIQLLKNNFSDSRIKYFSKKNGGLSDARNYGVTKSMGEYIWFIDSDDYITDINALQKIYDVLQFNLNVDVIAFNMEVCFENNHRKAYVMENVIENTKVMSSYDYISKYNIFPYNVTLQCYNRLFFIKNNYKFTKGIYFEDIYLNLDIYKKRVSIIGIKEVFYTYFRRDNSITSMKVNRNHFISQMLVLQKMNDYYCKNSLPKIYFEERLLIEYDRTKNCYRNEFIDIDYTIIKNISIPIIKNENISLKIEKKLFYYFPFVVLENQKLLRKINTLEQIIKKKILRKNDII